jgi:hypothetical protein
MGRLIAFLSIVALALWIARGPYLKWKQRRRLRQFESEQPRKWEGHKREWRSHMSATEFGVKAWGAGLYA